MNDEEYATIHEEYANIHVVVMHECGGVSYKVIIPITICDSFILIYFLKNVLSSF